MAENSTLVLRMLWRMHAAMAPGARILAHWLPRLQWCGPGTARCRPWTQSSSGNPRYPPGPALQALPSPPTEPRRSGLLLTRIFPALESSHPHTRARSNRTRKTAICNGKAGGQMLALAVCSLTPLTARDHLKRAALRLWVLQALDTGMRSEESGRVGAPALLTWHQPFGIFSAALACLRPLSEACSSVHPTRRHTPCASPVCTRMTRSRTRLQRVYL